MKMHIMMMFSNEQVEIVKLSVYDYYDHYDYTIIPAIISFIVVQMEIDGIDGSAIQRLS
jgi:hypothetical protein